MQSGDGGALGAIFTRGWEHPADAVRRMLAAAPHRGTNTSVVVLGEAAVGVTSAGDAHRNVAVADGLAVAFTGVVDNGADLEKTLGSRGRLPCSTTAQLLLAGWEQFGAALPPFLRGNYTVVITNGRTLWSFRDHLGFSPLFYRDTKAACYVGSEAKQVLAGAGLPRQADRDVCERIFFHKIDDDLPAALRGVSRLPKATVLTATRERSVTSRYWKPDRLLETARLTHDEVQDRFDELMGQAADRALAGSDVVSLSGGVDSPVVAAYAAPAHRQRFGTPLAAISTVYPDHPSVDERPYVEHVAEELGLVLHLNEHTPAPLRGQDEWAKLFDGPVPTVMVEEIERFYRLAGQMGYRNMLTGEIAEFVCDLPDGLMHHLIARGRVSAARGVAHRAGTPWWRIARQVVGAFAPSMVDAWRVRRFVTQRGIPEWLDADRVRRNYVDGLAAPRNRWRQLQLSGFTGPGLSMEADEICQDIAGVRCRRPFADVDLWEFFLSLPAEQKHPSPQRKALLRALARGTAPDAILDRRDKTVFNEVALATVDYEALKKWLLDPPERIAGVDYNGLALRLEQRNFTLLDYVWARDLSSIHAFLSTCGEAR